MEPEEYREWPICTLLEAVKDALQWAVGDSLAEIARLEENSTRAVEALKALGEIETEPCPLCSHPMWNVTQILECTNGIWLPGGGGSVLRFVTRYAPPIFGQGMPGWECSHCHAYPLGSAPTVDFLNHWTEAEPPKTPSALANLLFNAYPQITDVARPKVAGGWCVIYWLIRFEGHWYGLVGSKATIIERLML